MYCQHYCILFPTINNPKDDFENDRHHQHNSTMRNLFESDLFSYLILYLQSKKSEIF